MRRNTPWIRYLNFPYVNKPAMLSEFDEMGNSHYYILAPIGHLLLLLLVIRTARAKKKEETRYASNNPNKE